MYFSILSINWTGQAVTGEQLLILRNAAALHLKSEKKGTVFNFSHELCEGEITRKKKGVYGTFSGTFFTADLGTVRGERWTVDFMLPRGSENLVIDDDSVVLSVKPLSGRKGDLEFQKVNTRAVSGKKETLH